MRHRMLSVVPLVVAAAALLGGAAFAQVPVWSFPSWYDGGTGSSDEATAMVLTPDQDIIVTGLSRGTDMTYDVATVRIAAETGDTVWTRRYTGVGTDERVRKMVIDDSGNVFIAGKVYSAASDTDFVVLRYQVNGDLDWAYVSGLAGPDVATAVVPDGAGGCFVTGYGGGDFLTMQINASGGLAWSHYLNGPGGGTDRATAIALDDSGRLYVAGYGYGGPSTDYDFMTARYDTAAQDTVWVRTYDGTENSQPTLQADHAWAMALDGDGNIYVTGQAGEATSISLDATTVKYNPSGDTVWTHRIDPSGLVEDEAVAVAVDGDGYVYCAGTTWDYFFESEYDYVVYRITPDGNTDWYQINHGFVEDSLTAMVIDDYSNVYVTGYSDSYDIDWDYLTAKYSATGSFIWEVRYGDTEMDDDWPNDILVDELGNVYVTGYDNTNFNDDYCTIKYSEFDVGASVIVQPTDTFRHGATVHPRAWVRNYSALTLTFPVRLEVAPNVYFSLKNVANLAPFDSVLVEFDPWLVQVVGDFEVRCYTLLAGDKELVNDTSFGAVTTVNAWEQLAPAPAGPRDREVKDGGALAYIPGAQPGVYAFKGNNTTEFYRYDVLTDTWSVMESMPAFGTSGRKKRIKRGACLEPDTSGHYIYALKGNNSLEFWRFTLPDSGWTIMPDYPLGAKGRKVKGGTGLEYVPSQHRFYSCKGGNTYEFYSYDIATGAWEAKSNIPLGPRGKKAKYGSCMAYDGDNTIYFLKGGGYEFYSYSVSSDSWTARADLRDSETSSRRRKIKKGADLAYDPIFERVYATKGRKSVEFWYYDPAQDSWYESPDTIPGDVRRPPYRGSCMEYADGKIYFFNGNKTLLFLRYNADLPLFPDGGSDGPLARPVALPGLQLRLAAVPNPFVGRTRLRYSLGRPGRVRLAVYDVAGRSRGVFVDDFQPAGRYDIDLDAGRFAAGVYLAKLTVEDDRGSATVTRKLLLAR